MRKLATIILAAGASMAAGMTDALSRKEEAFNNRIYGFENIRRALQRQKRDHMRGANGSIAQGNRHGGPHLHQREIARRQRQQSRQLAKVA